VTVEQIQDAAQRRIDFERLSIVLVGDADSVVAELEKLNLGPISIERDEGPIELAPEESIEEQLGPLDDEANEIVLPVDDDPLKPTPIEVPDDGRPA
jgi:hypothetical protein